MFTIHKIPFKIENISTDNYIYLDIWSGIEAMGSQKDLLVCYLWTPGMMMRKEKIKEMVMGVSSWVIEWEWDEWMMGGGSWGIYLWIITDITVINIAGCGIFG